MRKARFSRPGWASVACPAVFLGLLVWFGCIRSETRGTAASVLTEYEQACRSEKGSRLTTTTRVQVERGEESTAPSPTTIFGSFEEFRQYADSVISVGMTEEQVNAALGRRGDRFEFPQWDSHQYTILMYGAYWVHVSDGKVVGTQVNFGF